MNKYNVGDFIELDNNYYGRKFKIISIINLPDIGYIYTLKSDALEFAHTIGQGYFQVNENDIVGKVL